MCKKKALDGQRNARPMSDKLQPKSAGKNLADSVSVNVCRPNNDFCELCLFTQKVKAAAAVFSSVEFVAAPDRLFEEV
jgi:hypothetical protein